MDKNVQALGHTRLPQVSQLLFQLASFFPDLSISLIKGFISSTRSPLQQIQSSFEAPSKLDPDIEEAASCNTLPGRFPRARTEGG